MSLTEIIAEECYKTPSADENTIRSFLNWLDRPSISERQNDTSTSQFTIKELEAAISRQKASKLPSDEFLVEWQMVFRKDGTSMVLISL